MADEIKTDTKKHQKTIKTNQHKTHARVVNQGMYDKFGPGPGGYRDTIGLGDEELVIQSRSGKEWKPTRASGVLTRIKASSDDGGGVAYITKDEGALLIADKFTAKHTDYGSNEAGYTEKKLIEDGVTMIKDGSGQTWGYKDDDLYWFDDQRDVYRKVTNDQAMQYKVENGILIPNGAKKWYLTEIGLYNYID